MNDLPKIGIDIGSTSIKVVELAPLGKEKWKLLGAATAPAIKGGVLGGAANVTALAQLIVKMMKEAKMRSRKVVAALPEEQVSTHIVEMPLMTDDEVKQALQWQVEQYIPIPVDRVVWSYQIVKKDEAKGGIEVLLVAAAKDLVEAYTAVLQQAGLEPVALETELVGAVRSEVDANIPLALLVEIGETTTDVGVVRYGQLVFSRTIPTAGNAFTRAIETSLTIDSAQAQQYRNTYGFSKDQLDGKLVEVMRPVLNLIAGEVKKTADFYVAKHQGEVVKAVIVSGGMALLPDLVSNFSEMVGMEVAIGNPFTKVQVNKIDDGLTYGVAVGLAMRGL